MGWMTAIDLPSWSEALPCPWSAGWELVRQQPLPREGMDGRPLGGFSAAAYSAGDDRLWLLSDAPQAYLLPVLGLKPWIGRGVPARIGRRLVLRGTDGTPLPASMDGEGLVVQGDQAWIVSEARGPRDRPAQLLRVSLRDGRLLQRQGLPASWRPTATTGLARNQGPESLTLQSDASLLTAAEAPLRQDQARGGVARVPVAALTPQQSWTALGHLAIGPAGAAAARFQGLTELLALDGPSGVLALHRSFPATGQWTARLSLHSAPPELKPLTGWDLLALGLPSDNWEGLAWGPRLPDGRRTLVAVSDDNFNPLQRNWIVVLVPRQVPPRADPSAQPQQCIPAEVLSD